MYSIITDRGLANLFGSEFCKIVISPGTKVHEFHFDRHATDSLKHLLSSNTCICSNINEKCHLTSQTLVHSKKEFPTHHAVPLG